MEYKAMIVIVMRMMMVMAVMINLVMSYLLSMTLDVSLEPTSSLSPGVWCGRLPWVRATVAAGAAPCGC